MIYVNSETILKIDRFSLLRYERVIHIWDILFLTITYRIFLLYRQQFCAETVAPCFLQVLPVYYQTGTFRYLLSYYL